MDWNMEWSLYWPLTRVASTVGLLSGRGYMGNYPSSTSCSTPCSIFCSRLTQFVFFCLGCCFSSAVRSSMFNSFSSVVCGVLHRPLRQHDSAITTTLEASLQEHNGSISTTPKTYVKKLACEIAEKCTCILYFSQHRYHYSTFTDVFTVQRYNTLMWGSLRLVPNNLHFINEVAVASNHTLLNAQYLVFICRYTNLVINVCTNHTKWLHTYTSFTKNLKLYTQCSFSASH